MYLNFLAMDACDNVNILKISYLVKQLLNIAFILIPIALILIVSVDFFRAVMSDEEGMKNNTSLAIKRLIYAAVIFLIPTLVKFSMNNLVDSNVGYAKCLKVTKSMIKSQIIANKEECVNEDNEWDATSNECILKDNVVNKKISFNSGSVLIHNSSTNEESSDETTTTNLEGKNNKEKIWLYLRKKGLSKAGTAGVMGNLQREHNFKTSDAGGGLGLVQWIGNRRKSCIALAKKQGKSYTDLGVQLDFMWKELQGYKDLLNTLKSTNDVWTSTKEFCNKFERPAWRMVTPDTLKHYKSGKIKNEKSKRYIYAKEIYEQYKNAD